VVWLLRHWLVMITGDGVSGRERPAAQIFAEELRRLREARGLSQNDLASLINSGSSQVGMVESGKRVPSLDFARAADEALGTVGTLVRLAELLRTASFASWFRPYVALEMEAVKLRSWQGSVVDGLLQVPSYGRALFGAHLGISDEEVEQQVAARLARQEVLSRQDPPVLWVILDETVLRRPVGGAEVMRHQVEHLISFSDSKTIVIQVLPLATGSHVGLDGSFAIADLAANPAIGYIETALTGLVIEQREGVSFLENRYDGLRAEALPRAASTQLMKDVLKELWSI
jgi:transcriptional regulator with XRE-family HTH domain